MEQRQKKRILIFLVIPLLALILFLTDDLTIRLITLALIIIYVAFIIFLRDSIRFSGGFKISEDKDTAADDFASTSQPDFEDSFKIVSKSRNLEVITDENYRPEYGVSKTTDRKSVV